MTNINLLKDELIKRNIVNENEYLEAYLNLIENSLKNRCGDAHHSIPINTYAEVPVTKQYSYERYSAAQRRAKVAIARKDTANVLVNLRKPEHYLAHAYLVLCVKDEFVESNDIVPGMKLGYLRTIPKTIEEHKFIALSYINDYINGNIVYNEIKKEIGRTK